MIYRMLASLVFTLSLGLGLGWKLGLIPVHYGPARSGTLESADQTAADEAADSPGELPLADADDLAPGWTADQGEPPVVLVGEFDERGDGL